jgi:hypothetical protein
VYVEDYKYFDYIHIEMIRELLVRGDMMRVSCLGIGRDQLGKKR